MRFSAALLCVFLIIGAAQAQTPSAPADAHALLKRMLDAENSLPLMGTQSTTLTRSGASSVQRVWRNGTRAVRVEYVQPPRLAGEQMVDNGHLFWHYIPSTATLEVGPSRLGRMRRRVPQVMQQLSKGGLLVRSQGQETIAGRVCAIVDVSARAGGPRRRFWIDPASGAQMAVEQYGPDGKQRSASRFSEITLNPVFAKDTWQPPRVPSNVRVVPLENGPALPTIAAAQGQAQFPLLQPAFLPNGYRFQSASVSAFRGRQIVSLRYGDGLNVLSLFQTPLPPNAPPPDAKIGRPRPGVLTWAQGHVRVVLVGNGPPADLERVITSLR